MNTIGTCLLALGMLAPADQAAVSARVSVAQAKGEAGKGDKTAKPKFTVSKETTHVTGPLTPSGLVDYATALNKRLSKGVTPKNNAAVLLWRAFGPHPEGTTMPPEFFKWLGEQPPEDGKYFTDLYDHLRKQHKGDPEKQMKEVDDLFERVTERPWTAKKFPQVAAYLKANAKPLALVVEASKRPHYFSPLVVRGEGGLIGALLPGAQKCRGFASALEARAMLHIGEGRYNEAWQDLLACHRLGRLVARGGTMIEGLVGVAIDAIASAGDQVFLARAELTAQQLKDRLGDLQRLPPMPRFADKVDLGERFIFLDSTLWIARAGVPTLEGLFGKRTPKAVDPKVERLWKAIDWDPALRNANRWYDRMAKTMRLKDPRDREKQLDKLETELKALKVELVSSGALNKALLDEKLSPAARGTILGDALVTLLLPAVRKVALAGDRTEQTHANLHVGFALAAYKRDHGSYPNKLEALAPKYLAEIPQDLFSGKALIYRPSEKGFLLYSVGINGRDEQGRSYDDDPPGDDLAVRIPLPAPRRK
jgi:hypothetical protein